MKKRYYLLLVGLVLVASIVIYYFVSQKKRQYDLVSPKVGSVNEAIYGLGTVVSKDKFSFKVGVPNTISDLYVFEGQSVVKGQKILKFIDGTLVTSPFDGTVFSLPYHTGENVFADRPVVEIENLNSLFVEAILDQQSSMRAKKSAPVRISFETLENKYFMGKVISLYHSKDQFIARVEVPELPKEILPGMTADVAIEVAQKDNALLVPVRGVNLGSVLIERDGKRQKVNVSLGVMDQEWVEVTSDTIKPTDLILLKKAL